MRETLTEKKYVENVFSCKIDHRQSTRRRIPLKWEIIHFIQKNDFCENVHRACRNVSPWMAVKIFEIQNEQRTSATANFTFLWFNIDLSWHCPFLLVRTVPTRVGMTDAIFRSHLKLYSSINSRILVQIQYTLSGKINRATVDLSKY